MGRVQMSNETNEKKVTGKYVVEQLDNLFKDDEYGFEVFALMKGEEKQLKRFVFYERNRDISLKVKVMNMIAQSIIQQFDVNEEEYAFVENIADNQNKIYIIEQDEEYKPFDCIEGAKSNVNSFDMEDIDQVEALLFKFRRGTESIWAHQLVSPILIPNKKKENILVKAFSPDNSDKLVEMDESLFPITRNVDLLLVDDCIITKKINIMQSRYGFETYIRMQAEKVVADITRTGIVDNVAKLSDYIGRTKKTYAKKMMRIKQYNVINKLSDELIRCIKQSDRWKDVFQIKKNKIVLNKYEDVENLIDLFDERYTTSEITGDEFDTDVKKLASR